VSRVLLLATVLFACAGGSVRGSVTLVGGPSFASGTVALTGPVNRSSSVGPDGHYSFSGLPTGTYLLAATVPSAVAAPQTIVVNAEHPAQTIDLVVDAVGTVSGLVTGSQVPLSGALVTVADTGQQATSAGDGTFTIAHVTAGLHWLHVAPTQYQAIDTPTFAVGYDQTTPVPPIDFEPNLLSTGSLRGRVILTGTGPVASATAEITGHVLEPALTDGNGYFVFASIPGGNYTLKVSLDHTVEQSQTLRDILVDRDAVTNAGDVTFTPD
jgi:hypothetical protein